MAKLIWALPCSRILVDQPTNMVSYIDVLDGVGFHTFPVQAPLAFIATLWQREDDKTLEVRVRVYDADGKKLMDSDPVSIAFQPNHKRFRVHIGVTGFQIEKPGRYGFGVQVKTSGKWNELNRIPLDVDQAIKVEADPVVH